MTKLFITFVFFCAISQSLQQNACINKVNCSECIQENGCEWCADPFVENPCQEKNVESKCSKNNLVSPKSTSQIVKDLNLQSEANFPPIQIKPQEMVINLRKGEKFEINYQYAQASNVPIDLYFLMDLSASMKIHKNNLAKLGDNLIDLMRNITSDFRIGFGSFVDKVSFPFASTIPDILSRNCENCTETYLFKNHMSLNTGENFTKEIDKAPVSGNLEDPEGGFEALMQVMLCTDEIGWRDNARHIIVYSTDEHFHLAGDGKLAGIIEPNDLKCHMRNNQYDKDLLYDYPSISQINYVAIQNKFNIFFTVAGKFNTYLELNGHIANSQTARLSEDSEIAQLVYNFHKTLASSKDFSRISGEAANHVKFNIEKISKDCVNQKGISTVCNGIEIGEVIDITATIQPLDCFKNKQIIINPGSEDEQLIVTLNVICDCDGLCESQSNSDLCQKHGDLTCGTCDCQEGYYGKNCECDGTNSYQNLTSCENNNVVCSNRGTCECGICKCYLASNGIRYTGKFCECDSSSCEYSCSGNGVCECGKCKCKIGWSGDDCSCTTRKDTCIDNKKVCNDKGTCQCGKCRCQEGFYGTFCDECAGCISKRCLEVKPCVECKVFNIGDYAEVCEEKCKDYKFEILDEIHDVDTANVKVCSFSDDNGCLMMFKYDLDNPDKISVAKELKCPSPLNILVVIVATIGRILLIGIFTLIGWKLLTYYMDKKEYARFVDEQSSARWHNEQNPLFRTPVTQFQNPTYRN